MTNDTQNQQEMSHETQDADSRHADRVEAYEERKANRIERMENRADRAAALAVELSNRARKMGEAIPFGQPILIGHHSENRDRNYRGRIHSLHERAFKLEKFAESSARRAEVAGTNHAISSDDPNAPDKLGAKLARLEKDQAMMKAANGAWKKAGAAGLAAIGWTDAEIAAIEVTIARAWSCEKRPFARYALTNNGAEIRRLKKRIVETQAINERALKDDEVTQVGACQVIRAFADNRLRIAFPGKPPRETITALKRGGFRWSPSVGMWQAYLTRGREYNAQQIVAAFNV